MNEIVRTYHLVKTVTWLMLGIVMATHCGSSSENILFSKFSTGADIEGTVAPAQEIVVTEDASIKINPGVRKGAVELNLRGSDFLSVESLPSGETFVSLESNDSTMELTVVGEESVHFNISGPMGDFWFKSTDSEFIIRDLIVDQKSGMLVAETKSGPLDLVSPFFAAMTRKSNQTVLLQIPSLNIDLKLTHFSCGS